MAQPFIGEIRQAGFNFVPPGWLACQGQIISISENETLFNLIGTTYGGDGVSTFGIPDLRGRAMIHQGQLLGGGNYVIGQKAGTESVTLTQNQMALHSHTVAAKDGLGTISIPTTKSTWAQVTPDGQTAITAYSAAPGNATLASTVVSPSGSSLPVDIRQPYVVVNFIIATVGIYPSPA
jgi:microcystin-dependent protein